MSVWIKNYFCRCPVLFILVFFQTVSYGKGRSVDSDKLCDISRQNFGNGKIEANHVMLKTRKSVMAAQSQGRDCWLVAVKRNWEARDILAAVKEKDGDWHVRVALAVDANEKMKLFPEKRLELILKNLPSDFEQLWIDTAQYKITAQSFAFAIRLKTRGEGTGGSTTTEKFILLAQESNSLQNILERTSLESFEGRPGSDDDDRENRDYEYTESYKMLKNKTDNYFDIEATVQREKKSKVLFRWSNGSYREVK